MIIDTHLHLIDKSALNYPWLGGVPELNRDFLFETYQKQAARCGITAALHMEVDVLTDAIQAETDHIQQISNRSDGFIKGAIVSCRPEEAGFAEYLEQQQRNPFVKGFRRVLHVVPDELSEGVLFRENITRLEGTGLTFDLCTLPHQTDKVLALADLAPDAQFVLDHCGVPDIKSGALRAGKRVSLRLRNAIMSLPRFLVLLPMRKLKAGRSTRCGPMWSMSSSRLAGSALYGAATGLFAH